MKRMAMDKMRMTIAITQAQKDAIEAGRQIVNPESRIVRSDIEKMGEPMAQAWEEEG